RSICPRRASGSVAAVCSALATISPTSANGASATLSARAWRNAMTPSPDIQTPQPGMEAGPGRKLRIAAVGDLHVGETSHRVYRDLFDRVHEDADVLCLCGDLVNFGKSGEVENLLEDLRA